MSKKNLKISIPKEAMAEFKMVEKYDWSEGVGLEDLVVWINWVAERFRPDEIDESTRASQELTERSFRHYQTLGCIDKPGRAGRKAVYGFRHYLQALVLRKLTWERMPSTQIASLMEGRSNEDLKSLLFDGIEIVPVKQAPRDAIHAAKGPESWSRIELVPGLEIHIGESLGSMSANEITKLTKQFKALLESR